MINLSILGISLQGETQNPVLLLHPEGTNQVLSLLIGPMEAFAISSGLNLTLPEREGAVAYLGPPQADGAEVPSPRAGKPSRPMTHDLMLAVMHSLGGVLTAVEILGIENGVYMAEAVISAPTGLVRLDCRPSDGVALAVRCGAALRAREGVLAYADEMETVLAGLPEHVRELVQGNLSGVPAGPKSRLKVSLGFKGSLDQMTLTPVERRKDQDGAEVKESVTVPGQAKIKTVSVSAPQLTVQIRGQNQPEAKVISGAIPKTSLSPMTIMSSLGDNATEDERWTELLRQISPENKEIM